ncbi:MAG: prefoldin subunit [Nanoarchaeota archaeon]|nr:prefoldin subunit [Nanoarchaeota archaeon]MBU1320977.1 prefoldin subunit [Nanoarchaeota archaeon]MBU1598362.1 prefoldin subunit [Nanoarchaeota archaeon]MBU2441736.1 prefoldin subunit [Nanoarchaeota archaeon]
MNAETQNKINQLSLMEQNLQNFAMQKQHFQAQLMEFESAENELKDSKEAFKIIGNIMVSRDKAELQKEVAEKKELIQKRIESFEKQEGKIKEKAEALQKEVLDEMKKSEKA